MEVPLTNSDKVALVDDGWEEDVLCQKWYLDFTGYARTTHNTGFGRILLHHLIMGQKPGLQIDHINGNRLDNRETNLRHVTRSQQKMNSARRRDNRSGCRGFGFIESIG